MGSIPTASTINMFTKEYLKFEHKNLKNLEDLWYKTKDPDLRIAILHARRALKRIYDGGDRLSTRLTKV